MKKTKTKYAMTLIWEEGTTDTFFFYSSEDIKDGEKSEFLDLIMTDYLEEEGYDIKTDLPIDYVVDTYDNWCFTQSVLEQEALINSYLEDYEEDPFGILPH